MMPRRASRGFTLVELMVVVIIVGVLATIGVSSFRARIFGSKSTEALAMIQSIRAAEERYKAENLTYLDVSKNGWYPAAPVKRTKRAFYATTKACTPTEDSDDCRWKRLNPTIPGPTSFAFQVNAGPPSAAMTEPAIKPSDWNKWPDQHEHWYVIQAEADMDGDGVMAYFLASSRRGDVFSMNEGE